MVTSGYTKQGGKTTRSGGGGGGTIATEENAQEFLEQAPSTGSLELARESLRQFEASATPQEKELFQNALNNKEFRQTGIDSRIDYMGDYAKQSRIPGRDIGRFADAFNMSFNGAGPSRTDKSKTYSQEILQGRFQRAYNNLSTTQRNVLATRIYPSRSALNNASRSNSSTKYGRDIARRAEAVFKARDAAIERRGDDLF